MLSDSLTVLDISGIDAPAATIGDLAVGTIDVWENADVKNDLSVGSGLVVGANGIYSQGNVTATSILANTSVCIGSDCRTEWPTGGGGGNTTDEMRTAINGSDITLSSLEVNKQVNLSGTLFVNESGVIGFGTANLNPWWSGYRAVDFTYSSLCANNGGTQIGLSSNAYMNATANWVYKTSAVPAAMYIQNSGTHDFRYASAGTAGNPITWSRGLYIDDSGRVGIGDNIYPDAELHVQGGACIDTDDACTDPGDGNLTAHSLIATTGMTLGGEYRTTWPSGDISNGSDVWFGNVGIGTSSPSSKLEVSGSGTNGLSLNVTGDLYVNDSSGRVGIGTTDPSTKLHIKDDDAHLSLEDASYGVVTGLKSEDYYGYVGTSSDFPFIVKTNSTNALFIDTSQEVGIGTTDPDAELHVKGGVCIDDNDACTDPGDGNLTAHSLIATTGMTLGGEYRTTWPSGDISNGSDVWFGSVGIGTESPTEKLHVHEGGVNISNSQNGTMMYIDNATGNVGIGTASPSHTLQLVGEGYIGAIGDFGTTLSKRMFGGNMYYDSGWQARTTETHATYGYPGVEAGWGNLYFYGLGNVATTAGGAITPTLRMFINGQTGNVGIGTASPGEKLEVNDGNIYVHGNDGGEGRVIMQLDGNDQFEWYPQATGLHLYDRTAGAYRMSILNDGNVGIGTASPAVSLDIAGTHVSSTGIGRITGTTHAFLSLNANDSGDQSGLYFSEGGTPQMQLRYNGVSNAIDFYDVSATATRMVIEETGKVGIGTASPSKELEVSDGTYGITFDPNDGADSYGIINTTGGTNLTIHSSGGSVIIKLGA